VSADRSTRTVRCGGAGAIRRRWYRALAYAVASTSESGAVFEALATDPVPWVTVRPRALLDALPSADARLTLESAPVRFALNEPPGSWARSWHTLVLATVGEPVEAFRTEVGRDSAAVVPPSAGGVWVAFQTHWIREPSGEVWVARRYAIAAPDATSLRKRRTAVGTLLSEEWSFRLGVPATSAPAPLGTRRDWRRGTIRAVPRAAWVAREPDRLAETAEVDHSPFVPTSSEGHAVVFGASGTGKTAWLVERAADAIGRGTPVVAIDLHGDLAPRLVARLPAADRRRIVAIDASDRPVPGIAALSSGGPRDDATASHLVASLKRLSPDGTELHWGFRLERVLDCFVRLAQETGGTVLDVYDLLSNPARRDAARLATRRPELARFLDELDPILRRQPDFLWSAATRLAKLVVVPGVAELLAPRHEGLPVEDLLARGRSIIVRVPFATLGPEASTFAGSLLLGRVYLGLAARRTGQDVPTPVLFVLDEAHGFSPRLLTELLTESRKFGIRALLATQFPDRFAPEVRHAVAGSPTEFVTFRVPPAAAVAIGEWVGLSREDGSRWLPGLPPGHGIALDVERGIPRSFVVSPGAAPETGPWADQVRETRTEFDVEGSDVAAPGDVEALTERLLFTVLAAEEEGRPVEPGLVVVRALTLPGPPPPTELLGSRWTELLRERLVWVEGDGCRLTDAGQRRLGLSVPTGAVRESPLHRALLVAVFRLFARRGYRIEIVRQGRFDTTLPDARFRQLATPSTASPARLAEELDRIRTGWAWRFFGGRDVHIEVEVSGARRPERIRRGWKKANDRGAFALFVVGDATSARQVRATLRRLAIGPDRAQVWTLRCPEARSRPAERPSP
jgi:hypothetical protein